MADNSIDKFWEMVDDFDTCMVVTRDGGKLRARPMAPRIDHERRQILFLTERSSHKVDEIESDAEVAVTFSKHDEYVSVSGRAHVSGDRQLIDKIWDAEAEAWMPEDKNDPNVAVLVVEPDQAEVWDTRTNKITQAWEFAKALVGEKDRPDIGTNIKVAL